MLLVGPIVEAPVDVPLGSSFSSATSSGQGYDFSVNDLLFKVAASDKNPYQRATAQFRKDQLDTGQSAGDQSLTGWWTRGQFSFHKGAGVTYYEVSEGETVLNRFKDGEGLDPFTTLGHVTCQHAWDAYSTSVAALSYVSAIGSDLVVLDGSTVKYGDFNATPTTYAPAASATVRAVTVSPTTIYAALDNGKIASVDPMTDTETTLYTGLSTTIRGIWYVKNRLLISDSDNKWYQLATNPSGAPVAVTSDDVIFTGVDWVADSCVTTSPGPILIGNSNSVYAATLDSTGAIPTISAPIQVAELPPGETVSAVAYHLGFVILVTGAGVRVAVLSDSGQLTYGPLLVERETATSTFLGTSVARYGTRVSVVVDNRIIEIDLSEQVGNGLEFGWIGRGNPFTGSPTSAGVTTLEITTQVAWTEGGLWASTSDLMSGHIQTGYHRFNTLEPKRFDSVRVHMDGDSGTVEVIRVNSSGAELSLYTLDVSTTHIEELSLQFDDGEESVALKFVLTPDADALTVSPILLGYQIRALPDPARQELIRVPLECYDLERRQPARTSGRAGLAWSRFQDLKEQENSGAIVTFRDFRTGETGQAYIESVEFANVTPPSAKSTGFGGVVNLTLRKLS